MTATVQLSHFNFLWCPFPYNLVTMVCFLWEIMFPSSYFLVHVVRWRPISFTAPDMSMLFRQGHSEKYILLTPLIGSEKNM